MKNEYADKTEAKKLKMARDNYRIFMVIQGEINKDD